MKIKSDKEKKFFEIIKTVRSLRYQEEQFVDGIEVVDFPSYNQTKFRIGDSTFLYTQSSITRLMMYGGWKGENCFYINNDADSKSKWVLVVHSDLEYVVWYGSKAVLNRIIDSIYKEIANE